MRQHKPYRPYRSSKTRPYKPRSFVRSRDWRARDVLLLGAVAIVGVGSLSSWLSGDRSGEAQGLVSAEAANVFYRYCSDARAAGAAPLYAGEPGYRSELDRDGDGVACEPYYGS